MERKSQGFVGEMEIYCSERPDLADLFLETVQVLAKRFVWRERSLFSQSKRPKCRFALADRVSKRPNVSVIAYAKELCVTVACVLEDVDYLKSALPSVFEYEMRAGRHGDLWPLFIFRLRDRDQLKILSELDVARYFCAQATGKMPVNDYVEAPDERVLREILTRRQQANFRKVLLAQYGGACVITGCTVDAALEAAHILGHADDGSYEVENGLILRADVHKLFDAGLLSIDENGVVELDSRCRGSEYECYQGKKLACFSEAMQQNFVRRNESSVRS